MAAGDVTILGFSNRTIRGKRVLWGNVQLDGLNPTPMDLSQYFSVIESVVLTLQNQGAMPGIGAAAIPSMFASDTIGNPTRVNVWAFAPTSATDATPIASTNTAAKVDFIVMGRP